MICVRSKKLFASVQLLGCLVVASCQPQTQSPQRHCTSPIGAVMIEGGTYSVGTNLAYPEEGPEHLVEVRTFWIDKSEVTVAKFAEFVDQTRYRTNAERSVDLAAFAGLVMTDEEKKLYLSPGGAVFNPSSFVSHRKRNWWSYVPGAYWRHPNGPDTPAARPEEPVTQIALEDAIAYAEWAGGRLPREAEWEIAARGGARSSTIDQAPPTNANTWQGVFPVVDEATDGFKGVSPVGCYEPNPFGLHDMLGNVWEWTTDPYQNHRDYASSLEPITLSLIKSSSVVATVKGGSYLCAPNFCMRYRPTARHAQEAGLSTNHIGFRIVYDMDPETILADEREP